MLVVDDSVHARTITKMVLQAIDAEVREAPDGEAGLRELRKWAPDLVIVDYEMRPVDGAEFTWRLRTREAEQRQPRTPVLMVTGHNSASIVANAVQAGVDGFINKPITTGMLLSRVEKVLEQVRRSNGGAAKPRPAAPPRPVHYVDESARAAKRQAG